MATAFQRQIEAKNNPSAAQAPSADSADAQPVEAGASAPVAQTAKLEGQISEVLCGRPPEVLFTLTAEGQSPLLHVRDISKLEIRQGGHPSTVADLPCSKWKDRKASVVFRPTAPGSAQGEVESIDLQ